jgi:L-ascorbate metabolism protein UlaG (beta-lactamase superfamily)
MNRFFQAQFFVIILALLAAPMMVVAGADTISASKGPVKISLLGHASLMFQFSDKVIYVDPFSKMADYSKLPKADLILVTHHHGDHLDLGAIGKIRKDSTKIVSNPSAAKELKAPIIMKNNDVKTVMGIEIQAIPAYNIVHMRSSKKPFHPEGVGNGYILKFADKRIYVAGDTENTPEMKALKDIDAAFLPINLPYTMNAEMVADAVKAFKPKILYPYHYDMGKSDLGNLDKAMEGIKDVEVRILK